MVLFLFEYQGKNTVPYGSFAPDANEAKLQRVMGYATPMVVYNESTGSHVKAGSAMGSTPPAEIKP